MVEMGEVVQRLSHRAATQAAYGAIHKTATCTGRHNDYLEVWQMVVRLYETPPLPRPWQRGCLLVLKRVT
jgi:hypothetical protein